MEKTIAGKILKSHLVSGNLLPGNEITIRIDQTLTQDATGTMAYLQLEAMGVTRVATELSVSYVDHNTLQQGFENADDHRYLRTVAAKYGVLYSRAGNGICHQVHLERYSRPGKTLLGSDSHTPTAGGMGMIAIGAGGLDVALAMATGTYTLTVPKVTRVKLTGKLSPWVSAKDVILALLRILTTKGNVNTLVEYAGPGVATLSVPERATITNMGAELGVTTSVFPSDRVTRKFLASQQREDQWAELKPDKGACYDNKVEIDLSTLEPLAALPHSPDNIKPIRELSDVAVDQVCLGSCTNSSYKDLVTVAEMLRGETVHPNVSLVVAPGSRQVLRMIADSGALALLIDAGARIAESACGFCIGMGSAPNSGGVSLRTSNRNFLGRSGTKDANVYLVSPEVAGASALTGRITDPRTMGEPPRVKLPKRLAVDDSMILMPPADGSKVEVLRGPNIGEPPTASAPAEHLKGVVAITLGDKITTDHICPAGERMKYRSNVAKYAEFAFERVDAEFAKRASASRDQGLANVIVAGLSYGQGSSREHAAMCPLYLGVRMVLAKSIERIHRANLINFGIVPATFANADDYGKLAQGDMLRIEGLREAIARGGKLVLVNETKRVTMEIVCELSETDREVLLAGGKLALVKQQGK